MFFIAYFLNDTLTYTRPCLFIDIVFLFAVWWCIAALKAPLLYLWICHAREVIFELWIDTPYIFLTIRFHYIKKVSFLLYVYHKKILVLEVNTFILLHLWRIYFCINLFYVCCVIFSLPVKLFIEIVTQSTWIVYPFYTAKLSNIYLMCSIVVFTGIVSVIYSRIVGNIMIILLRFLCLIYVQYTDESWPTTAICFNRC